MDIGQMGGGDKLFAKIDSGIRAAKLVVCCVTDQYAQSPNCNREVTVFAVLLGRPTTGDNSPEVLYYSRVLFLTTRTTLVHPAQRRPGNIRGWVIG